MDDGQPARRSRIAVVATVAAAIGFMLIGAAFVRGVLDADTPVAVDAPVPGQEDAVFTRREVERGTYGDDPAMDALWDGCARGVFDDCDTLYFEAAPSSAYERFGDSCGLRNEPAGLCVSIYATSDTPPADEDPDLPALQANCAAGFMEACDRLWLHSPAGSEQERFAATCGDRREREDGGTCSR